MSNIDLAQWRQRLDGAFFPAVLVPFTDHRDIDNAAHQAYTSYLSAQPISGVAVWAHTGRGLKLNARQRQEVLTLWKQSLGKDKIIIAGVGSPPEIATRDEYISRAVNMAAEAAAFGADALLVHPPILYRGAAESQAMQVEGNRIVNRAATSGASAAAGRSPASTRLARQPTVEDQEEAIFEYHQKIASTGLPLVLFYLYEAAGGIRYSPRLLRRLFSMPQVVGIKMATLDSVMAFQDVAHMVTEEFPEKILITGEDRFFGYSLMCGARAALVGMGSVCVRLQRSLLQSYLAHDAPRFIELSDLVDALGQALFVHPMEGYIRRLLWTLVHLKVLPPDAAHDPWGPELDPFENEALVKVLEQLGEWAS
jgi:4-hydroxy-tetrahydrodipicolinate synthase